MKKKLLVLLITLASTMMPNLASAVAIDGFSEAQIQRVIEICQALPNCASECQEWLCNAQPPPPPNDCDYSSPAGC